MQTALTWLARAALLAVLAVAFAGAMDPLHNAARNVPAPDVVEHIEFGYLLTLLTIISAPRVKPWWIGAGFLALGAGFEVAQIYGLVSGTFQLKDLASNTVGVAAALIPMLIAGRRTARR